MNCMPDFDSERQKLDGRRASAAFELAIIEHAVRYVQEHLVANGADAEPVAACDDALEAVAALKARKA